MGIRDTKKALRRAEELFKEASLSENISLGRSNLLESTAKHVEKLEKELAAFEAEIEALYVLVVNTVLMIMPIKLRKEIVKAPIAIFIAGSIEERYESHKVNSAAASAWFWTLARSYSWPDGSGNG